MAKAKKSAPKPASQKEIDSYEHKGSDRVSIPQVGLVKPETDPDTGKKKKYAYDPHLDPQLQWTGKAEHTSFEVPTASLHIHERIDPRRIVESVRAKEDTPQLSLFETEKKPLREAIEFYKHKENWSNRLIAGDSLVVMNSLLEKEGMAGKVQMVYFDPPYGIKYGSNFMPFVNKRDVKDGSDDDLSSEPEMLKAFRDTWELGLHSYLTYLRDRFLLAKELLNESGSMFIQISEENMHLIKQISDEIFGMENYVSTIIAQRTTGLGTRLLPRQQDYILWVCKDIQKIKYHQLFIKRELSTDELKTYRFYQEDNGNSRTLTEEEKEDITKIKNPSKLFMVDNLTKPGPGRKYPVIINGKTYLPGTRWWGVTEVGMEKLVDVGRIYELKNSIGYKRFFYDFPYSYETNFWKDTSGAGSAQKLYVVQTNPLMIQKCLLMSTDPGDIVLDITCGSGTTAFVAEQWGRRWITCDTSRIALTLAKQRLMTATFDFYELAHLKDGVASGFKYKTVPHVTLKSIANNEPADHEILYDQPIIDSKRIRVTGPFTVEAVPAPTVLSLEDTLINEADSLSADKSIVRKGETRRQEDWRSELLRTGVRAKGGAKIEFSRVEPIQGTTYLQAEAETKEANPKKVLVCFGPEHAPLEQRLVELALEEAGNTKPKPDMILFCAFQFDEEASKDIDETNWPAVALLKAQMNMDLQTDDLKKGNRSSESFWLIGQPDIELIKVGEGKVEVSVNGFDYYNPKTGEVESGGKDKIAMWMLDHNYDGRSLLPSQVFLPLSGAKEGWSTLAKNLKAEIDEDKMEAYSGTVSLPFIPGKQVAVKIIDDRGIESLKIIRL
jgi:adenine-specific DNA-methyltransferase